MIRVLFVCTGNICRSPMADAVFQHLVRQMGLQDQFVVDSAGTGEWHVGEKAHRGTLNILKQHDVPYDGRARKLLQNEAGNWDYILAMDESHMTYMKHYWDGDRDNVRLFLRDANQAGTTDLEEVPDPYYDGRFAEVYDLVVKGCTALLDTIRKEHQLG